MIPTSDLISSRQHPLVQLIRTLHSSKGRRQHKLFLIEGQNAVSAALGVDFPIRQVLCDESETQWSDLALDKGVDVKRATREIMAYAGEAQSSLPILALGEIPGAATANFPDFTLVLDGVSDPGNVGTLWRAADAAGAGGVMSLGGADPFSPKVVRSAAGSIFHLPPLSLPDLAPDSSPETATETLISQLKLQNIPIVAAQVHEGQSCFDFEWPARAALVLGHETRGISPELSESAEFSVTIPLFGRAESLNAAMAGTVLLYSWAKSRAR